MSVRLTSATRAKRTYLIFKFTHFLPPVQVSPVKISSKWTSSSQLFPSVCSVYQAANYSMSTPLIAVLACASILFSLLHASQSATVAPLCQPGIIEEMPPHIKKVCMALENSDQLTTALKSYINNEAATLVSKSEDLLTNYGKRTDVDHVFLRFGKRR